MATAAVGGTAAELGGGKFANGAATAAFLQTTVEAFEYYGRTVGWQPDVTPGEKLFIDPITGKCCEYTPVTGVRTPGPSFNVIGHNHVLTGSLLADIGKQGSLLSSALNYVPGINATAHLHDVWLNASTVRGPWASRVANYGTMLPAAAVSYSGALGSIVEGWRSDPMSWSQIRGYP